MVASRRGQYMAAIVMGPMVVIVQDGNWRLGGAIYGLVVGVQVGVEGQGGDGVAFATLARTDRLVDALVAVLLTAGAFRARLIALLLLDGRELAIVNQVRRMVTLSLLVIVSTGTHKR